MSTEQAKGENEEFNLADVWSPYDDLAFLMYTDSEVQHLECTANLNFKYRTGLNNRLGVF